MDLRSGLLYIYSSYTHIEQVTNPFILYSELQDLCKDSLKTKEQIKEFYNISKRLNITEALLDKGIVDGKRYLLDIYPIYSSYFTKEKLDKYITIVIDVIEYKNNSLSMVEQKPKKKKNDLYGFLIKDGILYKYKGKKKVVHIPKEVKIIKSEAFDSLNNLEEIHIPSSVKTIESHAFRFLPMLDYVYLDDIQYVSKQAFWRCFPTICLKDKYTPLFWDKEWNVYDKVLFFNKKIKIKYKY